MIYEDFRVPAAIGVGALGLFYGYNRLIVYLSREEEAESVRLDQESEAAARESGKLKADRYLIKPTRQIDDPDYLNIPSFSGKGVYKSKLMADDDLSSGPLQSERNRS